MKCAGELGGRRRISRCEREKYGESVMHTRTQCHHEFCQHHWLQQRGIWFSYIIKSAVRGVGSESSCQHQQLCDAPGHSQMLATSRDSRARTVQTARERIRIKNALFYQENKEQLLSLKSLFRLQVPKWSHVENLTLPRGWHHGRQAQNAKLD